MPIRIILSVLIFICLMACKEGMKKPSSTIMITDPAQQQVTFKNLVNLTGHQLSTDELKDSVAFLILPVKLSCPACRKKTIDSIVKHQNSLLNRHYIIISASEGRKNISSYFLEQDHEMPEMPNQLFLDTTHQAHKIDLVKENPVLYYAFEEKVYKMVSAIPATVKEDLREFFSGKRSEQLLTQH